MYNVRRRKQLGRTSVPRTSSLEGALAERTRRINEAVVARDLNALRELAVTRFGLVNSGLRRLCWPLLLHAPDVSQCIVPETSHRDERQVALDVKRSMNHISKARRMSSKKERKRELEEVIVGVLRRNPMLHYYQGFHDVCSCFLLVLGAKAAMPAAENAALFLFRDAMSDSLEPILAQLHLLYPLLKRESENVYNFLENAMVPPYFCLSWILTWCSHDISELSTVERLFDFFLASTPIMPLYFVAAVILSRQDELLNEVECEYAAVHTFLSRFPKSADVESLIAESRRMYSEIPSDTLQGLGEQLNERSCINTYDETFGSVSLESCLDIAQVQNLIIPSSKSSDPESPSSKPPLKRKFLQSFFIDSTIRGRKSAKQSIVRLRTEWTVRISEAGVSGMVVAIVVSSAVTALAGALMATGYWKG